MPGYARPRVAVPQHYRLPVAAMPDARRHIAGAEMLELEAFEHVYSGSHAIRVRDEAARAPLEPDRSRLSAPSGRRGQMGMATGLLEESRFVSCRGPGARSPCS